MSNYKITKYHVAQYDREPENTLDKIIRNEAKNSDRVFGFFRISLVVLLFWVVASMGGLSVEEDKAIEEITKGIVTGANGNVNFTGVENPIALEQISRDNYDYKPMTPQRVMVTGYFNGAGEYLTLTGQTLGSLNGSNLEVVGKVTTPNGTYYDITQDGESIGLIHEDLVVMWLSPGEVEMTNGREMGYEYNTEDFIGFLASYKHVAESYGILPSVMIAQALVESGVNGDSGLAIYSKNLYGIKGQYKGNGKTYETLEDSENKGLQAIQDTFRVYPTYKDSVYDYLELIGNTPRYADVNKHKTAELQITAIKNAGYATDRAYVKKVLDVINKYGLTRYDG